MLSKYSTFLILRRVARLARTFEQDGPTKWAERARGPVLPTVPSDHLIFTTVTAHLGLCEFASCTVAFVSLNFHFKQSYHVIHTFWPNTGNSYGFMYRGCLVSNSKHALELSFRRYCNGRSRRGHCRLRESTFDTRNTESNLFEGGSS